jgi:hypothetical protein
MKIYPTSYNEKTGELNQWDWATRSSKPNQVTYTDSGILPSADPQQINPKFFPIFDRAIMAAVIRHNALGEMPYRLEESRSGYTVKDFAWTLVRSDNNREAELVVEAFTVASNYNTGGEAGVRKAVEEFLLDKSKVGTV